MTEYLFAKMRNQKYDSDRFIADSGATSHMVNSEENMTNLKDTETRVTIGDSRTFICKKCGDWHGYRELDKKIHCMMLSDTAVIIGLHASLFSMTRAL